MKHYDYIFTGSGLSALMTVYKMIVSNEFKSKSILLLDENPKKENDRTWCFWEKENSIWEKCIFKTWDFALFKNPSFARNLELSPYQYHQIKGIDFYNFVFNLINQQENITFFNEKVTDINELQTHVFVKTTEHEFTGDRVFNSILSVENFKNQEKYAVLQQHFVGWFIQTKEPFFEDSQCTFMDFSVAQKENTRFMYVLPTSKTEALIEYTLFSKDILTIPEYEFEIKKYLDQLGIDKYQIVEKEKGTIPMTCYPFWKNNKKRVLQIGTAGGWTKASTGYTFKKTEKKTTELVRFLLKGKDFKTFYKKDKFWFYDLLLLDILFRRNELGCSIFSSLFKKGNSALIFKFLDEETNLYEDLQVIMKCPKLPFIKALCRILFQKRYIN